MNTDGSNDQNPYASPTIDHQPSMPIDRTGGLVRHVRVVAICMIVQGLMEILYAAYLASMGFWMPSFFAQQPNQMPQGQAEIMQNIFVWFYVLGGLILAIGLIRVVAGILGFQYRGRVLGIVSHFLGILSVITCYCLPTAVAICVFGSLVYFNREVIRAFRMKKEGCTNDEIRAEFV